MSSFYHDTALWLTDFWVQPMFSRGPRNSFLLFQLDILENFVILRASWIKLELIGLSWMRLDQNGSNEIN